MRGEMIGINTAIATNSLTRGLHGHRLCHPEQDDQGDPPLAQGGQGDRPWVPGRANRQPGRLWTGLRQDLRTGHDEGVLVEDVYDDTPGSQGRPEDGRRHPLLRRQTDQGGQRPDQPWSPRPRPGTKVNLKVWRDRKEITIPVTIEKQPRDFFSWGERRGAEGEEDEE